MRTNKEQKVTIGDVAARAHSSVSSVSRVIHNHKGIHADVRSRIEQAIRDLQYHPAPRKRRSKPSYRYIYFLLTNRDPQQFHAKVLQVLDDECTRRGDLLLFRALRYAPEMPTDELDDHLRNRVFLNQGKALAQGMVLTGQTSPNLLGALERTEIPFVILGNNYTGSEVNADSVSFDLRQGGYDATRYLIDLGHKNILFIGDINYDWFDEIYKGYLSALGESNLLPLAQTKALSDNWYSNGYLSVGMALEQPKELTAIFAAHDEMALGALKALNDRSLAVPQQVSVIGFEDEDYASFTVPPLTTVKVDAVAFGREMINQLYKNFADQPRKLTSVRLPTVLVKRGSCRPLSTF